MKRMSDINDLQQEVQDAADNAPDNIDTRQGSAADAAEAAKRESAKKLSLIRDVLSQKQAVDLECIDISGISVIADYFVICTAKNRAHMGALIDAVDEVVHRNGYACRNAEGSYQNGWVLIDCGDVIVHLFSEQQRGFYDLERIWRDGRPV